MDKLDKETLVKIVKLVQKQGMKGAKGGWKEFLDFHDKRFGSSLSDPAKRSIDTLIAFLTTFTKEEDLEFIAKITKNRERIEELAKSSSDVESPQQRLVRLTIEHPLYGKYYDPITSFNEEWVVTKLGKVSKAIKSTAMIAVDCEMVLCEDGTEAVVKVCLVDHNLVVKLDKLVNPNKAVADYRTEITGISAKDLEGVTSSLVDIQKSLKKLLSHGTILVGHSLHNDLQALKLNHARAIDTSFIFKYLDETTHITPSLNNLCKSVLGYEVRRDDAPHNCRDDAVAAMKLVLAKIEHGFDDPIAVERKHVPETDFRKLFLHRIPIGVPSQELMKVFPPKFTVEVQPNCRVQGRRYSTFAIFKDSEAACEAFEKIEGKVEKDVHGRPQKLVSFQPKKGSTASVYVQKMTSDALLEKPDLLKRRLAQDEGVQSKKPKVDMLEEDCIKEYQCDHVKEIETLKQELRQKEEEISNLQKILSALTRKHGL
ncbi:small RNA degrading nuclease 3-like isoform X2 [Magnolia sinica]|uniref:small RNA degrading nuclease 3-like isoform X2 n=1 Tax=Magnolia sinica TaxID=86752 RepID=UPI00265B0DCB|nr:small RNA degrading nuclease 3-like isoform X2 [Magnolia sinica]